MESVPLEIVVPIYNEGEQVIKLLGKFETNINTKFRVLLCYDLDDDNIFKYKNELKSFNFEVILVKNPLSGPCEAIKAGLNYGKSDCVIVYPADDFLNINILDQMFSSFKDNNDVVVASRFVKGGSMKGCPLIKSILVRTASTTLYFLSSIPVKDASNGFRLFSRRLLNTINIESKVGFAYSLELLAKCNRLKFNISEVPAQWEERSEGSSRFKIFKWLPEYLRWYCYGLITTWLRKGIKDVKDKL
ncbi:glycosyltransferase [Pelagibacteraceae bacterium]|nr:glycosyltransferase [Pelagibacteraceae bacterium]